MKHSDKIDRIVAVCQARMREGHSPDINAICKIYPDLMPELEAALRGLKGDSRAIAPPDTTPSFIERPAGNAALLPCLSPALQQAVLEGTLPPENRPKVDEHLKTCDACRRELEERREFKRLFLDYDRCEREEAFFPAITLPSHEIIRWIGSGGAGDVWLARHVVMDEQRAIKTIALSPRDPSEQERLSQEAKIVGILDRPRRNRVIVHDCYVEKGYMVIVMEYVSGGSLSCHTSPETPMRWDRACKYVAEIARGLLDVHDRGVLHRDIKPSNVLLDETHDEALLGDFGLAALVAEANAIVGTPGYIAPELLTGGATTKSDVFSLAATLFHLVAGHRPFAADNVMASLALAAAGLPSPVPALRNVPWAVEEVILAGLEPKPAMRPDLKTFRARLRGARHQSLADHLRNVGSRSPVKLDVAVFTAKERQHIDRPVDCLALPREPHRNPELVPEPSLRATLTTGDWVRFEAKADTDGYLTVLSFSASGEKVQLFPNPPEADNRIPANQPQKVTIQLTAPAGTDQAVFLWTRQKESFTVEAWRKRVEAAGGVTVSPGESSRGMQSLLHEVGDEPPDAWTAQVVTIVHQESAASDASGGDTSLAPPVRGGEARADRRAECVSVPPTPSGTDAATAATSGLPAELASRPRRQPAQAALDPVDCSVFAPPGLPRGKTVFVQVFAHLPQQAAEAMNLAQTFDEDEQRRALKSLDLDIPRGEKLLFHLAVPGLEVDDPVQSLIWQGRTESVQFGVTATAGSDLPRSTVVGTVSVALGKQQVPVGNIKFKLAITAAESRGVTFRSRPAGELAHRFRKAFVSYASKDRTEVLKRVQLLEALKIDFFQDVLDLAPGQRWEQALYRHIDECDLFLLFWSTAAKQSPWVMEEVRYALRRKRDDDFLPPEILPVIVEGPPPVEPPENLKHLHFNSKLVYFMV